MLFTREGLCDKFLLQILGRNPEALRELKLGLPGSPCLVPFLTPLIFFDSDLRHAAGVSQWDRGE